MKKLISVLLILAMVLSLAACKGTPDSQPTTTSAPETTAAPETTEAAETTEATVETEPVPAAFPVTVTDHAGRTVTIAENPVKIVSGYYISTSAVIALGLKDRLVGIEAKAEKRAIYKLSAPELTDLPNVGTAKEFDLEGCIALEPDLVILPLKLKNAAESLEALDIPVLLVNPESQELLLSMVDLIAQATGAQENVQALYTFLQEQEAVLDGITGGEPTVYLAGNSGLLSTAGSNMYQSSMIDQAGGINAAAELTDMGWAEISYEQLLAWDPEYIILTSDAAYTVEDVLNDENLADCRAVVSGNVFHLPGDVEAWDSPVLSGILGSLWLASVLHPDVVTPEAASAAATAFYEQFYGFTLS